MTTKMMAMARWATARRDTMTTTMATGDDEDGNGAMGNKVDDDGNNNDYGNGQRQQRWQWRDGQQHDGI